jgi:hypothetical protein
MLIILRQVLNFPLFERCLSVHTSGTLASLDTTVAYRLFVPARDL